VTVLRIAHYGAGKRPSEPQNIMLGPCRRGALQFGEDIEVRGWPAPSSRWNAGHDRSLPRPTPVG
jgi:hypothetical protein